ncbi:methyltransferase domain-containing protein [Cytophagales bacterium LB-30]|uniref:Methyltransferase domain-containing protein n=1 Tax=Shiella aurantiaca TaxID=3058365 RepID=A0ABT8F7L7_9BACT|nr:methyltransferase domain-containing protein [Shiella aurantiaca]MDN4166427.1 methyltransferase domain-containing protein [Shiella aurantiaca]
MRNLDQRSHEEEIMDDLLFEGEMMDQTLRELDFINQWLGGNAVTLAAFRHFEDRMQVAKEVHVLDVGCGSGEMLRLLTDWAAKRGIRLIGIGIDANPHIVDYARKASEKYPDLQFLDYNIFSEEYKNLRTDIVLSTLFTHHFSEAQLIDYYTTAQKQARWGVITNDLHRNFLAYYSIKWLTAWFSKSEMVKFDAPLSVARGFKKKELSQLMRNFPEARFQLRWRWAFRWVLIWHTDDTH